MKKDFLPEIVKNDIYLQPFKDIFLNIIDKTKEIEEKICKKSSLFDFANAHLFYGLHKYETKWVYRDLLISADEAWLIGDFNNWQINDTFKLKCANEGQFYGEFPLDSIKHESQYRLVVKYNGELLYRIPAFTHRAVQDENSKVFNAQVWSPDQKYEFKHTAPDKKEYELIYEAHIGMSSELEGISTFNEFRIQILPKIITAGYTTIQLMAVQEHPYYGSFGYHVSSYFAVSSRFGTPEELKQLVDEAHKNGIRVIMDLVHSHAVKNEVEGIGKYDGTDYLYFHTGKRGEHPAWDSRCFNYSKPETLHFLLSNIKFWLTEYKFDGFRFDGVTSMLYLNHGLQMDFTSYDLYFSENTDIEAIAYLTLANKLIKQINPNAISIAEEMSGYPGVATPIEQGGVGFDYRLAMGMPDYWIKLIKEYKDEDWHMGDIFYQLTNKRVDEKTISYVESHDQALVGDKTILFRLADKDIYYNMSVFNFNLNVNRAIALHKMIRLITLTTAANGYLNFMGNEFGHPEWIDFPRLGNDWSYKHARRQWNLAENKDLAYFYLNIFDRDMISVMKKYNVFSEEYPYKIYENNTDKILVYRRNGLIFVYNFHTEKSYTEYGFEAPKGKYKIILNSDNPKYKGHNRIDENTEYQTIEDPKTKKHYLRIYAINRAVLVFEKI